MISTSREHNESEAQGSESKQITPGARMNPQSPYPMTGADKACSLTLKPNLRVSSFISY